MLWLGSMDEGGKGPRGDEREGSGEGAGSTVRSASPAGARPPSPSPLRPDLRSAMLSAAALSSRCIDSPRGSSAVSATRYTLWPFGWDRVG